MDLMKAQWMALALMGEHGLLPRWQFQFDNAVSRMGCCKHRSRTITLSRHVTSLNNEDHIRDTILHEIAHALAPRGAHHGPQWKEIALRIGCNGQRCGDETVVVPQAKFKGTCPTCSHSVTRHRRMVCSCHKCSGGKFNPSHKMVWERAA